MNGGKKMCHGQGKRDSRPGHWLRTHVVITEAPGTKLRVMSVLFGLMALLRVT